MKNIRVGFIGFGNMGSALAKGIAEAKILNDGNIYYHTPSKKDVPFNYVSKLTELYSECNVIICAVKPHIASRVLNQAEDYLHSRLLISICAGITIEKLEEMTDSQSKIVWVMPNTPCLVGEGTFIYCNNGSVIEHDKNILNYIFSACGKLIKLNEEYMDIGTAISGCGPAYICLFIESLIDAAVKNGLSRDVAKQLVVHTILGTAKMVQVLDTPVQQLKDNVVSPGGVTAMGLFTLEKNRFKYAIMDAVDAAFQKSKAMNK
ncbi:pyrroline-5-carboxylate reductase [Hepatocystis sp. ex Piliocolobus tephrosceles]|nr:pyrroline-5-carboxylate reductase [Hepatocystis sp. ex Piliocolobus tephrosceles]